MHPDLGRFNEIILKAKGIAEKERAEARIVMPSLDPANVPLAIRPLLQYAEILGVGDDPTRGKIFDKVPSEYIDIVKQAIAACPEVYEWSQHSETTESRNEPEVAAIGWMLIGLDD